MRLFRRSEIPEGQSVAETRRLAKQSRFGIIADAQEQDQQTTSLAENVASGDTVEIDA